jgi:hypothetical protein
LARFYLYWIPWTWLALRAEYQYEQIKFDPPDLNELLVAEIHTHRVPLGVGIFHPSGFNIGLKATYIDQEGKFEDMMGRFIPDNDQFWLMDAAIGYRLPQRLGLVGVELKNVFDRKFKFQDTDPINSRISPERLILFRFTLVF